jgi:accessory colonization factor AcfC
MASVTGFIFNSDVQCWSFFSLVLTALLAALMAPPAMAQPPAHQPRDGVVKLYGAGGPHTALRKVADLWERQSGHRVVITAGPEPTWAARAQRDADILWGTSEQSMTAFLASFPAFSSDQVEPIYIRPTIIAVKKGNPRRIRGFEDLLQSGIRIVVTEGAGVANTSGTGTWEDVAGRLGRLDDIRRFRRNIVAFARGSGASLRAFRDLNADAWITWPDWPVNHPDLLEAVPIAADRRLWRDLNVALSPAADPEAAAFLRFLDSPPAQALMGREGWQR